MEKKPILIIEGLEGDKHLNKNSSRHIMVRIDNLNQVKYVSKFLKLFISNKLKLNKIKIDLRTILKYNSFSSFRVEDKDTFIDFLIIDEKTKAFIFMSINSKRSNYSFSYDCQEFFSV